MFRRSNAKLLKLLEREFFYGKIIYRNVEKSIGVQVVRKGYTTRLKHDTYI